MRLICIPVLLLFVALAVARGQEIDSSWLAPTDTGGSDVPGLAMSRSPLTAVLLSIVPGGGQYYNDDYWKIPVFAGAAGWFVGRALYLNGQFNDINGQMSGMGPDSSLYGALHARREAIRNDRDMNLAYLLMVEALGMIDAYVGAHLFDFTVDGMAWRIEGTPGGASLRIHW